MKTRLLTLFAVWGVLHFTASFACAAATSVNISEDAQSLTIENGEIRLVFTKTGKNAGAIQSLAYRGRELLGGGVGYLQVALGPKAKPRPQWRLDVLRREPSVAEISLTNTDPNCPFDLAAHCIVRAGEPGFYNYLTIAHDVVRSPGVHELAQYDFCLRADPKIFTVAAVDDARIAPFPKPDELTRPRMVMASTYRLGDDSYYSKYFFSAEMNNRHRVHGAMGDGIGLWIVMPSHEHLNGGPEHQELTVHQTDTTPVLLRHATAAHYGAGVIRSDAKNGSWSKVSAPWFVYVNRAPTQQTLWQDAQRRAAEETAAWPYAWLDDARFQLKRGTVCGRLAFDNGEPASGAWVILAEHEETPGPLAWQQQWRGYRFHARAGADGRFRVEKVRPGFYDLYAWGAGKMGQFARSGVRATAGETADLGGLVWPQPRDRKLLWQIGVADRSAAEFGFAENFRQWGLWDKIAAAKPDGVTFTVGKHGARDWPFEMAVTQRDDLAWRAPVWRVEFQCDTAPVGRGVLTLGFAAFESLQRQRDAQLKLALNGVEIAAVRDLQESGGAHRSGIHAAYQERIVVFDVARLHAGVNVLTVELPAPARSVSKRLGYPAAAVLWDCLRMELESR